MKVEESEVDGDEKSKKIKKDYDVEVIIAFHGRRSRNLSKKKKKKQGKILILTICFSPCWLEILNKQKKSRLGLLAHVHFEQKFRFKLGSIKPSKNLGLSRLPLPPFSPILCFQHFSLSFTPWGLNTYPLGERKKS